MYANVVIDIVRNGVKYRCIDDYIGTSLPYKSTRLNL